MFYCKYDEPTVFTYLLPCSGSCTDEPEEVTFHKTPLPVDQDQLTFDSQQRQQPSLDDLDVTPEKEGIILYSYSILDHQSAVKQRILTNVFDICR